MTYREQLDMAQRSILDRALRAAGGNVSRMSRDLGLQRTYAQRLLRRHGLRGRGPQAPRKRDG